jgi:molecular chaperone GrpE
LKDKHIRLQAEFDNFRKRTLKEKMELLKSAGESILVNILPVIDDFDRALQTIGNTEQNDPVVDGVKLIYNKFQEFLKQNGIKEIEAKEKDFDTDLHEAVTKIPAPSEELKGKNVDVIQKGYMLNEKVIRFAKVVVGE